MDRYQNVCVWFMARNCRFPKVGTLCCQRGNHRLPLQATAGSQKLELTLPNLGTTGYHCKELPVPRGWNSLSPTWEPEVTIASKCRFPEVGTLGSQPGNHGLPLQATVKMIWKHVRYNFMVLINRPVQNAWFCLMDRYRNVCVWLMARNCWFPNRLPLQGTAGSQRMELFVPNLGTRGYHFKQLPVPRGWNSWYPTWEPQVTIARNCRFPEDGTLGSQPGSQRLPLQATEVGTHASQPGNHRLPLQGTAGPKRLELLVPNLGTMGYHCKQLLKWYENIFVTTLWFCLMDRYRTLGFAYWTGTRMFAFGSWQGTAGSQRLELSVANVGTTGYHCKELPVPRGWNSWFPTWEPEVTIASNCRFPEVGTHASQPGNHRLPLQGTSGSQRLELLVPNLGTMGYHCKQLLKWYENIFVTTLWFCLMDRYRTLGFA